jgi:hypothetical protein
MQKAEPVRRARALDFAKIGSTLPAPATSSEVVHVDSLPSSFVKKPDAVVGDAIGLADDIVPVIPPDRDLTDSNVSLDNSNVPQLSVDCTDSEVSLVIPPIPPNNDVSLDDSIPPLFAYSNVSQTSLEEGSLPGRSLSHANASLEMVPHCLMPFGKFLSLLALSRRLIFLLDDVSKDPAANTNSNIFPSALLDAGSHQLYPNRKCSGFLSRTCIGFANLLHSTRVHSEHWIWRPIRNR